MKEGEYTIESWKELITDMNDQELKETIDSMEYLLLSWVTSQQYAFKLRQGWILLKTKHYTERK